MEERGLSPRGTSLRVWGRRSLLWLAVAGSYYASARLAAHWRSTQGGRGGLLVMPASGIAFSAVQLGGPWLATAPAVAGLFSALRFGLPLESALLISAGAAGIGLAALAVTRRARLDPIGERVMDTIVRCAAATAGGLVIATCSIVALRIAGPVPNTLDYWCAALIASITGILVVSPFVRAWVQRTSLGVAAPREWLFLFLAAAAIGVSVSSGVFGSKSPTAYIVFPLVVWAALRTGRMGASTVIFVTAAVAATQASRGRGPFVGLRPLETTVSLDSFLIVFALTGMLLAGLESERRITETDMSEAEARHRSLIDRLPLATYTRSLNLDEPPLFVSQQTVDLLGYPLERWLAEPHFASSLVHPDDVELNAELNAASLTQDMVSGEYRMITADGRIVWVLDHMVVIRNEAGEPVEQQGFVVDISERKALEEQLASARQLEGLGLLAGGVAHDFNNLLTAISGYAQLALDHAGTDGQLLRRDIHEVQEAAARAADLTRRLLAFSRRQVLERAVVDLNDVVRDVLPLLAPVVGDSVEVVTILEPQLAHVRGDPGQLGQVILSLAANAADAMPGGGTLTIGTANETHEGGQFVVLSVSDTGIGMDATTLRRIFEPFFTTKDVGEGSGLGLAMVHGIVRQSGGQISVDSSPGNGATFRIALPRTYDAAFEVIPPSEPSPAGAERILLVEDEDVVRHLTAEMLERQGYEVVQAAGAAEALRVTEPWDLLLTDVVMPTMSGPELAAQLLTGRPEAGVLFMSGYSGGAIADRGELAGDLLEKPFTMQELGLKVRAALDARRAR